MTKGFVFDPSTGTMEFKDGVRDAWTVPSGKLVTRLPTPHTETNYNAVFPDFSKDRFYRHAWTSASNVGAGTWDLNESCATGISVLPQEWSSVVDLADAPDEANLFVMMIRLTRTVNPSHNWLNAAIPKLVKEDVWIPCTGSILLEGSLGMARAMSIYVDVDPMSSHYRKLVLHLEQSVAVAPGGYGTVGSGENVQVPTSGTANGGEFVYTTSAGVPVYIPASSPSVKSRYELYDPFVPIAPINPQLMRRGGAQQCTITDPTNYSSTWQFDLTGQFARIT